MSDDKVIKWQPVMLVTDHRVECECGALAIFVVLEHEQEDEEDTLKYYGWCQPCWKKAQEEIEAE